MKDNLINKSENLVNDTISRQAAINLFEKYGAEDDAIMLLNSLPPAQPGWIPVAERLPMENNSYLVWMPSTPEGHHITVAEWCSSYWNIKTPIMAWMPLPTPYREGEQE